MTNKYISTLVILLFAHNLVAQELPKNVFHINGGYSRILNKDHYHSPYLYQGNGLNTEIGYRRNGKKIIHIASLSYTAGQVHTSFSPNAKAKSFNLDYKLMAFNFNIGKFRVGTGSLIQSSGWAINYFPGELKGYSESDIISASLGLSLLCKYQINEKATLQLTADAPVLSYVNRVNLMNSKTRHEDLGFNLFHPRASIEYSYKITEGLDLYLNYQIDYLKYNAPVPIRTLHNSLGIGAKVNF